LVCTLIAAPGLMILRRAQRWVYIPADSGRVGLSEAGWGLLPILLSNEGGLQVRARPPGHWSARTDRGQGRVGPGRQSGIAHPRWIHLR